MNDKFMKKKEGLYKEKLEDFGKLYDEHKKQGNLEKLSSTLVADINNDATGKDGLVLFKALINAVDKDEYDSKKIEEMLNFFVEDDQIKPLLGEKLVKLSRECEFLSKTIQYRSVYPRLLELSLPYYNEKAMGVLGKLSREVKRSVARLAKWSIEENINDSYFEKELDLIEDEPSLKLEYEKNLKSSKNSNFFDESKKVIDSSGVLIYNNQIAVADLACAKLMPSLYKAYEEGNINNGSMIRGSGGETLQIFAQIIKNKGGDIMQYNTVCKMPLENIRNVTDHIHNAAVQTALVTVLSKMAYKSGAISKLANGFFETCKKGQGLFSWLYDTFREGVIMEAEGKERTF